MLSPEFIKSMWIERKREWNTYNEWANQQSHRHLVEIKYGNVCLPMHIVHQILEFMKHGSGMLDMFSKSQEFYFAALSTWKTLRVSYRNWYKIPILVWLNAKEIEVRFCGSCATDWADWSITKQRAINDAMVPSIAEAFKSHKKLTTLILRSGYSGSTRDLEWVAEVLKTNTTLKTLTIDGKNNDFETKCITEAIKKNSSITTFNLHGCTYYPEDVIDMLKTNSSLITLGFEYHRHDYDTKLRIAKVLMVRYKRINMQKKV